MRVAPDAECRWCGLKQADCLYEFQTKCYCGETYCPTHEDTEMHGCNRLLTGPVNPALYAAPPLDFGTTFATNDHARAPLSDFAPPPLAPPIT